MKLLPDIDLTPLAPYALLGVIAIVIVAGLVLRSLLHSRVALLIAIVIGIVIAGPALANAAAGIVGALVPLVIVLAGCAVGALYLLQRNPELMGLVRDLVPRRPVSAPQRDGWPQALSTPPHAEQGQGAVVIDAPKTTATPQRRSQVINQDTDRWGF